MTKSKTILVTVVLGVILGFSLSALAEDVPAGKEVIKIDRIPGKKGAVEFPHAKHASENKIECKKCHHQREGTAAPKNCAECHVKDGEAQKEYKGKKAPFFASAPDGKVDTGSVIFHKLCKDCHKGKTNAAGDKIDKCKTCHVGG